MVLVRIFQTLLLSQQYVRQLREIKPKDIRW